MDTGETMTASFFLGDRAMELREVPVPQPGPGQVLLRVQACGVCGTDHHIFEGSVTRGVTPPVVLGHEIAAVVEEVGPGVEGLDQGDTCVVDPVVGCGVCDKCRSGLTNLCYDPGVVGYKYNGGFAQYLIVPAGKVVLIDPSVGPAGGVLCETLACVLRGYDRLGFTAGSSALILGAGTVGLLWTQMLKNSPCGQLFQTEPVAFRRAKAQKLGAGHVLEPDNEDMRKAILWECPEGVDFIIDATGEPAAIEQAFPLLAPGGTFMLFGVCPAGSEIKLPAHEIFQKEAKIIGSKMPPGTLDRAARLIEAGRIECEEIVTDVLPLSDLPGAIEGFTTRRHDRLKVAIEPWR